MILPHASQIRAALLSPLGSAGITSLQVVGSEAVDFLSRVFRDAKSQKIELTLKQNKIYHGYIVDTQGRRIDQVLVCWTHLQQENCQAVDICCHGGVRPAQKVMETLVAAGACAVDASQLPAAGLAEFADLANATYSGVAAEALAELCRARTELAVDILSRQLQGGLTKELQRLLSQALPIQHLRRQLDTLLDTWRWGRRLIEPARIAIIGAVNAGKSSLANRLSGQSASIVTSQPGTTRDWVTHQISLAGLPVILIDTAGHRHTTDPLELEAIRLANQQARQADLQLMVIDGSTQTQIHPELCEHIKTVIAVNKADLPDFSLRAIAGDLAKLPHVKTSAITGVGLDELASVLLKALDCENVAQAQAVVFTERQRHCLQLAADALAKQGSESPHAAKQALTKCLHG